MKRICLSIAAAGALMFGVAAPVYAQTDVSVRYETTDENAFVDMEMTIEVDVDGNMRMQMNGMSTYYLLLENEMFVVSLEGEDTHVVRLSDVMTVASEAFERMGVEDAFADADGSAGFIFAEMGPETVGDREGVGFGIVSEEGDEGRWASLVISHDPQLAPIGQALARAQEAQLQNMGSMGTLLRNMSEPMQEALRGGAPLRMMNIEMTDVSFDEIPDERFVLPSEPIPIEELRAASRPAPPPPTLPPRSE